MAADSTVYGRKITSQDSIDITENYSAESSTSKASGIYAPDTLLTIGDIESNSNISATTTAPSSHSYGIYAKDMHITSLAGRVNAVAENSVQAFGLYVDGDADYGTLNINNLSGTITATGTNASAAGMWASGIVGRTGIIDIDTLSGSVSATSSNGEATGLYSNTLSITNLLGTVNSLSSGTIARLIVAYTNGTDASEGTYILNYSTGAASYGIYSINADIDTLAGTITSTASDGQAYGLFGSDGRLNIKTLSGTVQATSLGGTYTTASRFGATTAISAPAYGLNADSISIGTLSGTVQATSADGTAYGLYSSGTMNGGDASTAMLVSGTVKATGATGAYALYAEDAVNVLVTGTLGATTTNGTAYAIKTGNSADSVTLGTGARLTGVVDLGAGTDTLTLVGTGTTSTLFSNIENLAVGGGNTPTDWTWGTSSSSSSFDCVDIYSGANLTISSGARLNTGSLAVASGGRLSPTAAGQSTASIVASGNVTLAPGSSVNVVGTAAGVGKTSQLISAGSLTNNAAVSVANPNYSLTSVTTTPTSLSATLAYTPQADQGSMAIASTKAATDSFAGVATARAESIMLFADADTSAKQPKQVMLADASGTYALLAARGEPQWSMFALPVFSNTSRSAGSTGEGYDATTSGFTIGVDRFITRNLLAGLMVGVARTDVSFNGKAWYDDDSAQQDEILAGAYAGYHLDAWKFMDTLSYGSVQNDTIRRASETGFATADYQSHVARNEADALYSCELGDVVGGDWEIIPKLGLVTTYFHRGAYGEDADENAVSYDDFSKVFWEGRLSTRLSGHFTLAGENEGEAPLQVAPYVGVGVNHALADNDITMRQYISTTSAEVTMVEDDTSLEHEIGVVLSHGALALTLGYTGNESEHERSNTLSGMLHVMF